MDKSQDKKDQDGASANAQPSYQFESSGSGSVVGKDGEDLSHIYNQPKTGAEKFAAAQEQTQGTAKALKNKLTNRLNKIESNKVKTAVIIGGAVAIVALLVVVGFFIGNLIKQGNTASIIAQQEEAVAESNHVAMQMALDQTKTREEKDEELTAVLNRIDDLTRPDLPNPALFSAKSMILNHLQDYEGSIAAAEEAITIEDNALNRFFYYVSIIMTYKRLKNPSKELEYIDKLLGDEAAVNEAKKDQFELGTLNDTVIDRREELIGGAQ